MPFLPHARIAAYTAAFLLPAAFLGGTGSAARADVGESILHNFAGGTADGEYPYGSIVEASDGTIYGTTYYGGTYDEGTLFKIPMNGTESVIYNFSGTATDGSYPVSAVTIGTDGTLYGTTEEGGAASIGTIYSIQPDGSQFTLLHSFTGGADGSYPYSGGGAPLTLGNDGRLYGTTYGNSTQSDFGTVFSIDPDGTNYLVQYRFLDANGSNGKYPASNLTLAPGSGTTLYGFTYEGGSASEGVVYSLIPGSTNDSATVQALHSFGDGSVADDGEYPYYGALQVDTGGNLYGSTYAGGSANDGTVFRLSPNGSGYTETILHNFLDGTVANDGDEPYSGVLLATDGNLYGTCFYGGANSEGTTFSISPDGGNYAILYSFDAYSGDAAYPYAAPLEDSDGNLVGTTEEGGASNYGTVYKLATQLIPQPTLSSVGVSPSSMVGGQANATGTVTLNSSAHAGGALVYLNSSNSAAASVPASVTVPYGATSITFPVTTSAVSSDTSVSIAAFYNGQFQSATLTVTPPPVTAPANVRALVLSATAAQGPALVTGNRVYVHGNAPANETITLTSSDPSAVTVPASVIVTQGTSSRAFNLTVSKTAPNETVTITASFNGQTQTAQIAVSPSTPTSITLKSIVAYPSTVEGGATTMTNRVYFTGNAAATTVVSLTSSNPAVASVPKSVTVQQGYSSHVFTITTQPVTSAQQVTLTATANGVTQTTYLTVTP